MADKLQQILSYKQDEVAVLKRSRSMASLEADARSAPPVRDFAGRMLEMAARDETALICEMKRKSPSAGTINAVRPALETARAYERGGAACLSVLTDGPSFGGSLDDLIQIRAQVTIPVLRKDFMVDPMQVVEARAAGADAILIIMAGVDDALAAELHAAADEWGLSVLLEAHDEREFDRALLLPSPLLGVNNRNLKTFTTDLGVTEALAARAPEGRMLITESGVKSVADIQRLRACGARGFLVGEALMRSDDPAETVRDFASAR